MADKLKLGIIGMSEGNGHPYSWSAIFNGYNATAMSNCPFPAIPEYLMKQKFPEDGLGETGEVTHIWTQDKKTSEEIAAAANISNIVDEMQDMIGSIDAVLLARDDGNKHLEMAEPFLNAGLPIFIDKPLALNVDEAKKMLALQRYPDQIFSCSSLRYASELIVSKEDLEKIGKIRYVEASVPKYWDTYAVHIIEPIVTNLPDRGNLISVKSFEKNSIRMCLIEWENLTSFVKVTGKIPCSIEFKYFGEKGSLVKEFRDSFNCFKKSLDTFVKLIRKTEGNIPRSETLEIIKIIEDGRI